NREADELIREFHTRELMPVAQRLEGDGRALLALRPDPAVASYYRRRSRRQMSRQDFELPVPIGVEELEKALVELWTSDGFPELAALAPGVARIARSVYFTEDQDQEVSPFIYVMF